MYADRHDTEAKAALAEISRLLRQSEESEARIRKWDWTVGICAMSLMAVGAAWLVFVR